MSESAPRVVVADDSALMRRLLSSALSECGMTVVGLARDGDEALALCERERPDALSLDLAMPGRDGIGVLRGLRERNLAIPVVVVSAFSPASGARAVDALAEGAFDLVCKPSAGNAGFQAFVTELDTKFKLAVSSAAPRQPARTARAATPAVNGASPARNAVSPERNGPSPARRLVAGRGRTVVIACSTGGPKALAQLIPSLPAQLGRGVVIVQHMPPGFTGSLAARLDAQSPLTVREARDGDRPEPGVALLAPGGQHVRLRDGGCVALTDEPPIGGLRPRADLTIEDAARVWRDRILLVVLTGMGKDGLAGAQAVRQAHGRILVEAASSCTVYGMPRAVSEASLADEELDLSLLADAIVRGASS